MPREGDLVNMVFGLRLENARLNQNRLLKKGLVNTENGLHLESARLSPEILHPKDVVKMYLYPKKTKRCLRTISKIYTEIIHHLKKHLTCLNMRSMNLPTEVLFLEKHMKTEKIRSIFKSKIRLMHSSNMETLFRKKSYIHVFYFTI